MALKFTEEMLDKALDNAYGQQKVQSFEDTLQKALDNVYGQKQTAEVDASAVAVDKDISENNELQPKFKASGIEQDDSVDVKAEKLKAVIQPEKTVLPSELPDVVNYQGINDRQKAQEAAGRVRNVVGSAVAGTLGGITTAGQAAVQSVAGEKAQAFNRLLKENTNPQLGIDARQNTKQLVNELQTARENEVLNTDTFGTKMLAKADEYTQKAVEGLTPAGQFMTQTMISVLQNAALMPLGLINPALATGALAASRTGRSTYDSTMDGKNLSDAFTRGVIDGSIEYATEKIGVDAWLDLIAGEGGGIIKNLLKQSGSEAGEEALSYIAGWLMDVAQQEPDAAFSPQELMMSALGGGLSGLIMGGGTAAVVGRDNYLKAVNGETETKTTENVTENAENVTENADLQSNAKQQRAAENLQIVQQLEAQGIDTGNAVQELTEIATGEKARPAADPKVVEKENARVAAIEETARQGIATQEDVEKVRATASENIRQSENKAVVARKYGAEEINRVEELAQMKGYTVVYEADDSEDAPNGYIKEKTIYINASGNNPYFNVAVHEVLHGLSENTAKWSKLEKSVFQMINSDGDMTNFANAVVAKYTDNPDSVYYKSLLTDGKLDQTKLNEEIVANFVEEYLPKIAKNEEQLMTAIKKDRTVIDGLLDIIRGMKNNLAIKFAKSERAMLDEAERNLVNLMRAESREQEQARLSLKGRDNHGRSVYESDFPTGTSNKDKIKALEQALIDTQRSPLIFRINGRKISAYFDDTGVQKTTYGTQSDRNPESRKGFNAKRDLAKDLRSIIQNSKYVGNNVDDSIAYGAKAKNAAHKDVLQWYTFKNQIVYDETTFTVLTTVREKTNGSYAYSVKFFEQNKKSFQPGVQTTSPTVNTLKALSTNNIPQTSNNNNSKNLSGNNSQAQQRNSSSASTTQGKFSRKINYKDDKGNTLSDGQQEYFKDSKVRDDNGALMVVYHQTDADFTEFRTKSEGAGKYDGEMPDGIFTKPEDNDIGMKGKKQMPLYANITNPLRFKDRQQAGMYWKKNVEGYREAVRQIDAIDEEYQRKYDAADLLEDEEYKVIRQQLINKEITRDEFRARLENTETKKILKEWTEKSNQRRAEAKKLINEYISKTDYDGLIMENDRGSFGRKVKSIVAFSSNQLKNTDNSNPTDSNDIRYSEKVYHYDGENAKSRGIRRTAVNQLADSLGGMFGITDRNGRESLRKAVYEISDRVEKWGWISRADMDNLFDAAYAAGRAIDEKTDYAQLRKRIRETGIEPLGGREYLDFLQSYKGKIKFKRGGMPIDTLYQELSAQYPEYLDADISNPYEQMWQLGQAYDAISRKEMSLDEYYGDFAVQFKNTSYQEYSRQVDLFVERVNSISRYKKDNVEQKSAREQRQGAPTKTYTIDDINRAHKKAEGISKEISKLMADTPLTEADKNLLEDLQKIKNDNVRSAILKDMQENNPNAKVIYKLYNLKQELAEARVPIREFSKTNRERNRSRFMELLTTSKAWNEKHKFGGLRYKAETFERIIDDVVTDKKAAQRLKDMLPRSIHKHVAESNRYKNELRDRVRRLNLDNKKLYDVEFENNNNQVVTGQLTESGLVQIYGEGLVGKEYLEQIGADVEKITSAATEFRKIYNEMIEQINRAYVRNGYKPVEFRKDYFPHFMEDGTDTLLNKMTSWFGIDTMSKVPVKWSQGLSKLTVKDYTAGGMLPTEIAGTTYNRSPGRRWNAHALQRQGENTVYDALKGFDSYLETAADVIYLTDDIQNLRSFEDAIRYKFSDKGIQEEIDAIDEMDELSPQEKWIRKKAIYDDKNRNKYLNNFVSWLHNYTNLLAGKKDFADRQWEENLGRGIYQLSKDLESRVAANMVAGNISSAMTNFIPIAQMTSTVKEKYILAAMGDTVRNMKSNDGFDFQSDFLTNRFGSERLVDDSLAKKLENVKGIGQLLGVMESVDEFTSNVVVRAKYMQNINEGMTHEVAMQDADEFAASLMADRSKGALPTIFETKNPVTKALTMFQVEQNNQIQYLLKDLPRSLGEKEDIGKMLMLALLKYSIYSWLYNLIYEQIAGRKPAFSPIDLIADTGRDFYRVSKGQMKKSEAVSNAIVSVAEELPFAAAPLAMSGLSDDAGRLPISGALPDLSNVLKLFDDEVSAEKKKQLLYKEMSKPVYYLLFPVAGGQVKKTGEALNQMAVNDGVSYYTNNNGTKSVQFAVDTSNPLKWAQSAAFGRWSTKEARDYVEGGFDYMTKAESRMFEYLRGIGIDTAAAYKQAAGAKARADADGNGYLKTSEAKRYLDGLNMSRQDKANLFAIMCPTVKNNPYK